MSGTPSIQPQQPMKPGDGSAHGAEGENGKLGSGRSPVYRDVAPTSSPAAVPPAARDQGRISDEPDIFRGASGQPRLLRGVAVYSGATRLAEMAARIGFETVWIEMEHGPAGFDQ